jgi:hypothetical protein
MQGRRSVVQIVTRRRRSPSSFCPVLEALQQLGFVELGRLLLQPAERGAAAAEGAEAALAVFVDEVGEGAEAAAAGTGGAEIEARAMRVEGVGERVDALHRPHR